jgi:hypothetical protein
MTVQCSTVHQTMEGGRGAEKKKLEHASSSHEQDRRQIPTKGADMKLLRQELAYG